MINNLPFVLTPVSALGYGANKLDHYSAHSFRVTQLALRLRNHLKIRGFCQSHRPLMTTSGTATKRVNVAAGGM